MAIQKPGQLLIYGTDFHYGVYSFAVESVLGSGEIPGVVVVSTSTGYWLKTSPTDRPKREHVFNYSQRADGSWVVSANITLLVAGELPVNGTVVIRESSAESVTLTIDAAPPTSIERSLPSVLTVSQSTLTFAGSSPGKPAFQVLTIAQQPADAPVTLTTDTPDYFQLASDRQPAFAPSLTLVPSPTGTHVHVRYAPNRRGLHTGQLTIHSVYGNRTVVLEGRNAGLLSVPPIIKRGIGLLALAVAGGLAYAGYDNRWQLLPALCRDSASNQTSIDGPSAPVNAGDVTVGEKMISQETVPNAGISPAESPARPALTRRKTGRRRSVERPVPGVANEHQSVTLSRNADRSLSVRGAASKQTDGSAVDERPRRRVTPPLPTQESDLERELNKPKENQF